MRAWTALIAIVMAMLSAAPAAAQVDLEQYLRKDRFDTIKISPTGEYFAATVPLEDRTVLVVMRRADKTLTAKIGGSKDSVVYDFWWANDSRVVASIAQKFGIEDQPYGLGELFAVNVDGSRGLSLSGPALYTAAFLHDALRDDDRNVLISVVPFSDNPETSLEKMDVYTGRRTPIASAPVRRASFTTDAKGVARFAHGAGSDNVSKLYYRDGAGAPWQLINDEAQSGRIEWPLGFSADGATAYLQAQRTSGPDAIVAFDPVSKQRKELLRDAVVDPMRILNAVDSDAPAGAMFMHDRLRSRFFDDASPTARRYRSLEKAFPDDSVFVTSATKDGKLLLLQVSSDRNPGDFYLFDTEAKHAEPVFSRREWFDPAKMPAARAIAVQARDGLALHGYLTLPAQKTDVPLPMVVMPHGGPFGMFDAWGFDTETQILAAAGYAVLRINFRGSGNYGRAHEHAGAREWGGKMQDDVTDATRWAIAQKIADPNRICIFGASYGGYAALMGAAKEPQLYRCAVGYVGAYDLPLMHKDDSGGSKSMQVWASQWLGERDALAAVSPVALAARIKAPVFLAAGGKDKRLPIEHSETMERALKAANVPVETLYYPTEGHGFYTEPHRREFYGRLLDFLSRQIGGAKAK